MNNLKRVSTILSNGTKVDYKIVLTFKDNGSNKNYCVYTDDTIDQNNKLRFYVALYDSYLANPYLGEPVSTEEWNKITNIINSVIPLK